MSFPTGHNPYSAPETDIELIDTPLGGDLAEAELIRRQYARHEGAVKSIGLLDYLGSIFLVIFGVIILGSGGMVLVSDRLPEAQRAAATGGMMAGGAVMLVFGLFAGALGTAIRRLRPWARWVHIVLSVLSILQFIVLMFLLTSRPDGRQQLSSQVLPMILNIYILSLLGSSKGAVVFSASYRRIVEQTPHIRVGTSLIVKVLVGILLAVIGIGFIGIVMVSLSGRR